MTKTSFQRLFTIPSKLIDKEFFINRGKVPILSGPGYVNKILDFYCPFRLSSIARRAAKVLLKSRASAFS
jgi:hypothetical protein